jgi:5-hydroxyisourate hydrolase
MKSPITTHVLDTSIGKPAAGIEVRLFALDREGIAEIGRGTTNDEAASPI